MVQKTNKAKKSVVKKKIVTKKVIIKRRSPAAKSVTKPSETKAGVRPKIRVQTAEGWKRAKARTIRAKKQA